MTGIWYLSPAAVAVLGIAAAALSRVVRRRAAARLRRETQESGLRGLVRVMLSDPPSSASESARAPMVARHRGQTLVEFALVLPILMLVLLGIMQFGLIFWTQITLSQVARDAGRWAATQTYSPCTTGASAVQAQVNAIAAKSSLYGFPGSPVSTAVSWAKSSGTATCPPADNQTVWYVTIRLTHDVAIFLPFIADTCKPSCRKTLSSSVEYRMEPVP